MTVFPLLHRLENSAPMLLVYMTCMGMWVNGAMIGLMQISIKRLQSRIPKGHSLAPLECNVAATGGTGMRLAGQPHGSGSNLLDLGA